MRKLLITVILLGLCHAAVAGTIQERLLRDPAFKLYVAIFKVTLAADGSIGVQCAPSVDVRWVNAHPNADPKPLDIKLPKRFVAVAVGKIRAKYSFLNKASGQPKPFYTYFYYSPQFGDRVVEDVHERE